MNIKKKLLYISLFLISLPTTSLFPKNFYWEEPQILTENNARFYKAAYGGGIAAAVWQETIKESGGIKNIYLSIASSSDGTNWEHNVRFAGPFPCSGKETRIFSMAINEKDGTIYIAAAGNESKSITVFISSDGGKNFTSIRQNSDFFIVAPKIFVKEDGNPILFATKETKESLSIFYSVSETGGKTWSTFNPLAEENDLKMNFLPDFVSYGGTEYAVFQALIISDRTTYQIYMKKSTDGGKRWQKAQKLTYFDESAEGKGNLPAMNFDNQRASISIKNDTIAMVWERRAQGRRNSQQIYYAEFSTNGELIKPPEKISSGNYSCSYPILTGNGKSKTIFWFDNRYGGFRVVMADWNGRFWEDHQLSSMKGDSYFAQPVNISGSMYVLWENRRNGKSKIILLSPDKSVGTPSLCAVNFTEGKAASLNDFEFKWDLPDDSSGIEGFSYALSRKAETPDYMIKKRAGERHVSLEVAEDGIWYFSLSAKDFAGNWSKPAVIKLDRDTVPPGKIKFDPLAEDGKGFIKSNTFSVTWGPPPGEPISGYSCSIKNLSSDPYTKNAEALQKKEIEAPPSKIELLQNKKSYKNIDNGYWAFTVCAFDRAGNMGEKETIYLRTNKYIPVTYITSIIPKVDAAKRYDITILGRGFTAGGKISEMILDKDGKAPWDYTFSASNGDYKTETDRKISGFSPCDTDEGIYRIGLVHPKRGLYMTKPIIKLRPSGTVKFGDFRKTEDNIYIPIDKKIISISGDSAILTALLILLISALIFSFIKLKRLMHEKTSICNNINSLFSGTAITEEKKGRVKKMPKILIGLKVKFILFIMIIVISVVLIIAVSLGQFMMKLHRNNLAESFYEKTELLLENLASGARLYLPSSNVIELGLLTSSRAAMSDTLFTTITGKGSKEEGNFEYVWASDDTSILSKIDTEELLPGESLITDEISPMISGIADKINKKADAEIGEYVKEVEKLGEEAKKIISKGGNAERLDALQTQIAEYDRYISLKLIEIGKTIWSYPQFDLAAKKITARDYIFYKPIIYRQGANGSYYKGMIRLGVSTAEIAEGLKTSNRELIKRTVLAALAASFLGTAGAIILSNIIIRPIKNLIKGVETIRDTEDKEELKDYIISVKSKDEINLLAKTVNQMSKELAKAAAASKDLTMGKELQKMFIPLEKNSSGIKLTTGSETGEGFEFFGYYEGAKGVSGDYFDYVKIDRHNYAFIKCDVAGKGVPASLIMVEIATIFLNFFRNRDFRDTKKINLNELIKNINDLIEERGFKGRFAAIILAVINIKTGECKFCNAGDNIVHFYNSRKNAMEMLTLPEAPAAGVFPSSMVGDSFKQVAHDFAKGDIIFLFTDGIEEAKRNFRNSKFELITCQEEGLKPGEFHETHPVSSGNEEFGISRIHGVLNAVMNKRNYKLIKYHDPNKEEPIDFDFSECQGTAQNAILALVGAERMFRLYFDPSADKNDKISIDRKTNEFLKNYFVQYRRYFIDPKENKNNPEYIEYGNLKQDDQYDDLTILAFRLI